MNTLRASSIFLFLLGAAVTGACATGVDDLAGLLDTGSPVPVVVDAGDAARESADAPSFGGDSGEASDGAHTKDGPSGDGKSEHGDGGDDAPEDSGVDGPPDTGVDGGKDASADTGADSSVPTTCAEADDTIGCCVGDVLYYCKSKTLTQQTCKSTKVCGWNATEEYYACVAPPGGADPSGKYPIACK
jgi:hypothetical protein